MPPDINEILINRSCCQKSVARHNSMLKTKQDNYKPKYYKRQKVMFKTENRKPEIEARRIYGPGVIICNRNYRSYKINYQGKLFTRHENHIKAFHGGKNSNNTSIANTSVHSISTKQNTERRYPRRERLPVVRYGLNL